MDDARFDQIARSLAAGASRRRALRVLGGLFGTAAGLSIGRAHAVCNPDIDSCCGVNCGQCATCVDGACEPRSGSCFSDGNPCTNDVCQDGDCVHIPIVCPDDGNPCTDSVCQNGVCTPVNNTVACGDDGNPCTANICQSGVCAHPHLANGPQPACPVSTDPCKSPVCLNGACAFEQKVGKPCGGKCIDENACCTSGSPGCPNDQTCVDGQCKQSGTDPGISPPPPPLTCAENKKLCHARPASSQQDKCCPKSAKCVLATSGAVSCRKKKKK